ncbi:MAG: type II toxin-antitoxin system VapC family toxin [Bacteroidales bacterium]|nr:type II toxin-antitoxin system VapC family toxin [Bacteroidales bacterium]MCF8337460.1 type II toxin-antitoxin system VapC family toxin [Bacteroidales bacterium]
MILLDSSVLIELFRKQKKEKTLFYKIAKSYSPLYISSITHYEVGIGNRKSHFEYWHTLSNHLNVIPFDKSCSLTAIDVYNDLLKTNNLIDLADILIGATALTHNMSLATLNIKHFERIKDLPLFE